MSESILALVKSFLNKRLSANEFANAYMELWKFERDAELLQTDSQELSECLSSVFCLADLYEPNTDREDYELSEEQLRIEIEKLIVKFNI